MIKLVHSRRVNLKIQQNLQIDSSVQARPQEDFILVSNVPHIHTKVEDGIFKGENGNKASKVNSPAFIRYSYTVHICSPSLQNEAQVTIHLFEPI